MPRRSVVPGFRFNAKRRRASFEVVLPGTRGRRRCRKIVKAATRDEALALFRKFRAETLARTAAIPEFFSDYLKRFWPLVEMRLGKKAASYESSVVEKILKPFFGRYRLKEINAALLRDFVAQLRRRPYAPSTINRCVSVLRKILNDAVAREVIGEFPAKGRLAKEKETALRLELSNEEKARFLKSFDDESRFRDYFALNRSDGRVTSSPRFSGKPRIFGGPLRPRPGRVQNSDRRRERSAIMRRASRIGGCAGSSKSERSR